MNTYSFSNFIWLVWIKALSAAAVAVTKPMDFDECYSRLGLVAANNPTAAEINRSYRKAALKVHPDKGGDLAEVG